MTSRVTRSSARLAAAASNSIATASNPTIAEPEPPRPRHRKRKASSSAVASPEQPSYSPPALSATRSKRQKVAAAEALPSSPPAPRRRQSRQSAIMAKQGYQPSLISSAIQVDKSVVHHQRHQVGRLALHKRRQNPQSEKRVETRKLPQVFVDMASCSCQRLTSN